MAGPPHIRKVISMKVLFNDGHVDEVPADEELHVLRHSAAHIMAQAIKRLYPQADFAYGPATDNGFYYDIDLPEGTKISEDDFPAIEDEMRKICKENLKFETYELPRAEAIKQREVQGRAHRRPSRGRAHHVLQAGRVRRHVRGPAHPVHQGP